MAVLESAIPTAAIPLRPKGKDIKQYPTKEFMAGMIEWKNAGEPATFP